MGYAVVSEFDGEYAVHDSGYRSVPKKEDEPYGEYRHRIMDYWIHEFPYMVEQAQKAVSPCELVCVSETIPAKGSGNFAAAGQSELVKTAITTCQVLAHQMGVQWREIASSTIRKQVFGKASKPPKNNGKKRRKVTKVDMRNAVSHVFPHIVEGRVWLDDLQPDEIDGIAVGLTAVGFNRRRYDKGV